MKKSIGTLAALGMVTGVLGYFLFLEKNESKSMNQKYDKFKKYYQVYNKWIANNNRQVSNEAILKQLNISSIAVYGNGEMGNRLIESLKNTSVSIECIIEKKANDIEIDGMEGIKVIGVEELDHTIHPDAVIVTPIFDYDNIKEILQKKLPGVKIISIEEFVYYDWN